MPKFLALFLCFVSIPFLQAQEENLPDEFPHEIERDTTQNSLGNDLNKGRFEFHKRSFFMSTINKGALTDYSTLATGAGLGYYSPSWKGFHLGFSGFFVFQVFENNINKADPTTNSVNRYEILLYDMNDLDNKRDLDRLEDLYLTWEKKGFKAVLGRQKFNSPLLNEQDNRMRPNIFNGLSLNYLKNSWELHGAWFNAVTIRGTVDWYSIEESYGVYPFGRSPFGQASQYKGNIRTAGIGVLGAKHNKGKFKYEAWNYFNENVFNLTFAQSEFHTHINNKELHIGAQGFYQTAIHHGGNSEAIKAYIMPGESTYAIGAKAEIKNKKHLVSLNSLHVANAGRYLFPREWGREIFYATLPRERFEGSGGVNAFTLKYKYHPKPKGLTLEFGTSIVNQSDINDTRLNKYGLPSYYHFTGMLDYRFSGYLEGLDFKILVVNKTAQNPELVPEVFRINRVDLWHFNAVVDYRF